MKRRSQKTRAWRPAAILATVLALLLVLAGCVPAAPAEQASTGGEAAGDEKATVHLWHHWSTSRHPLLQEAVNKFMEENPDIEVVETLQPQEGILQKLLTSIAGGDPPEVAMLHRRNLLSFAAEEALAPLNEYIEANDISPDAWYPGEYDSNIYDGNVYGLPLTEGALFMNYNLPMWEEAGLDTYPETWDEYLEVAKGLTTLDDNGQVVIAGADIDANFGREFMKWLVTNGQPSIYSDDGTTALINTEAGVETLAFIKTLADETMGGYQNLLAFQSASSGLDQPPFASEMAATSGGAAWNFQVFRASNPELEYALAPYPSGPQGDGPLTVNQASWSYVVPRGAENQEAAWKLLHYLTVGDGARDFLQAQNRASPVIANNQADYYTENVPHWDEFLDVTSRRKTIGVSAVQPQVEKTLTEMVALVLAGELTPEEGAEWGNTETQKLLDEFWATR